MVFTIVCFAVIAFFVLAAMIRLAFFNVDEEIRQSTEEGERKYYLGLPVTLGALILPIVLALQLILEKLVGSDRTNISEEHKAIAETYRQANEVMLLDPLFLEQKIEILEKKITDFESNIDVALSMSNATTFIYI